MPKFFNTTGPCFPDRHYMLPAQARCSNLLKLIEQEHYFVIHAARQSGKTTLLLDLTKQLNDIMRYIVRWRVCRALLRLKKAF